jgi:predicted secreted protein
MTLATGIAVYVVVWWIVLFAVLPWGVRPPETLVPGQADSAPDNPRLLLKAAVTTVIAGVVWAGIYLVVRSDLMSFRTMTQ